MEGMDEKVEVMEEVKMWRGWRGREDGYGGGGGDKWGGGVERWRGGVEV